MLASPDMNTQLVAAFFFKSTGHTRIRCAPSSLEHTRKLSVQSADPRLPPFVKEMLHGYLSPLSFAQIRNARLVCLRLFRQAIRLALALARESAGSRSPAKMAMMAITTSNSISVNAVNFSFIIESAPQRERGSLHSKFHESINLDFHASNLTSTRFILTQVTPEVANSRRLGL